MYQGMLTGLALALVWPSITLAEDWPSFRGPRGNGTSLDSHPPTQWSSEANIKWKFKMPQSGNGSPIVSNGRVFVTSAQDVDGKQRSLYCLDRKNGKQLWVKTVEIKKKMPTHQTNPYCGSTPAADGESVVVWHGSAGVFCYDFSGVERWSRNLGEFEHIWGYGSSPILLKDKVILHSGPGRRALITALDLRTGDTIWETEEPIENQGNSRNAAGQYEGSWCTPVLAKVEGETQILCTMPTRLNAYDPESGSLIWFCEGIRGPKGDLAYSSPMVEGNRCVAIGGFGGPGIGVALGGRGNVTQKQRLWRLDKNPQSIGTGVFIGGRVYRANAARPAPIECMDPATGKILWNSDPKGGICWGSIVVADGLGYVTNRKGTTIVFKIDPEKYVAIASNDLGEPCHATPAISDREIFIRTFERLYCISESK